MISKDIKNTEEIAKKFLKQISKQNKTATVVGLYGDLGTGKTTFTQMMAKTLGIKRKVNSPTFVIMKKYILPLPKGSARRARGSKSPLLIPPLRRGGEFKYLFHIDAYRLKNEKELLALGWGEMILSPENLIFIEWPENIKKAMPKKHHQIHIKHTKEGYRKFEIKNV